MSRFNPFVALAAGGLLLGLVASPAQAGHGDDLDRLGDRIERRHDRRGERIDRHLDRKGARIDRRLDHLSDHAGAHGWNRLARRLDRHGDRVERRLDRKGDRVQRRLGKRGDRIDRRLDHRGKHHGHGPLEHDPDWTDDPGL